VHPATPPESSLGRVLFRFGLPGTVATLLITIGAFGVGWLPLRTGVIEFPLVEALRTTTSGLLVAHSMVFIGIALLLQVWLVLGHHLSAGLQIRPWSLGAVVALWCVPLLASPPMFSRDVYSYYLQGRLMDAGFDPYSTGVAQIPGWFQDGVDPMWAESPAPYGPLFLLISRGVSNFSYEQPALAALVFRLVALIGVALMVAVIPRIAQAHGIDPARAVWLGAMNPLVVMHFVAGAHNDALMVGLIMVGFALALQKLPVWAAIAIALAASVKPIALLALPFIGLIWAGQRAGWGRRIWTWVATAGIAVAAFAVTAIVAGVGWGWISALGTPGEVRTWLSPPTAIGMITGGIGQFLGWTDTNDAFVAALRALGTVAALAIVAWLALKPEGRSPVRGAAWAFTVVVLLGPVLQPWYLLWFLPLFAVTGLTVAGLRWVTLVIAGFAVHGMAESLATADNLFEITDGLGIVAAFAIVSIVLIASGRERRLLLGTDSAPPLLPLDASSKARAQELFPWPPTWQDRRS
jgi:alpha-1,6-mannosyltransferase